MGAGCGQVVRAAGQCGRDPQQSPLRVGHHLHVHAVSAVFGGVVGPAVAQAVTLRESAVEQDVVGIGLAQHLEQARCAVGEQVDHRGGVGVSGAHRDAKADGDLGEHVVLTQVRQAFERTLVRREFAASVTLAGDDEHRDPLDQGVEQVECGRTGNQRGSCAGGLRLRTPRSTAWEPCALRIPVASPDRWPR